MIHTGRQGNGDGIGFLNDYRRVNVAMTRAKQSFWVVGDCDALEVDPVWRKFVEDAASRSFIRNSQNFWSILDGARKRLSNEFRNRGPPSPGKRKKAPRTKR